MKINVLTIFPGMFDAVLGESIIKRAVNKKIVKITPDDLRNFTDNKHRKVDDKPFGGGPGMVMMAQPIYKAIEKIAGIKKLKSKAQLIKKGARTILLTPQGKRLNQALANKFAGSKHLILICGHYEGIDERVRQITTDEISIGDYVLTGGELPAMVLVDSIVRLLPGALGDEESTKFESFQMNLIEHPHYTRPRVFRESGVPQVLLSGDHARIEKWRYDQAIKRTKKRRPDLLKIKRR